MFDGSWQAIFENNTKRQIELFLKHALYWCSSVIRSILQVIIFFFSVPGAPFRIIAFQQMKPFGYWTVKRPVYPSLQKRRETTFRHLTDQNLIKKKIWLEKKQHLGMHDMLVKCKLNVIQCIFNYLCSFLFCQHLKLLNLLIYLIFTNLI